MLLEITGGKGAVQVNGKIHQKSSTLIISGGDELAFSASGQPAYVSFSYIFQAANTDCFTFFPPFSVYCFSCSVVNVILPFKA